MTPRNVRAAAGLTLSAGLLVAACGSDAGTASSTADPAAATSAAVAAEPATRLSANNATEDELQTIPGVGENIAHEIVEYRPYDAETGPAKFRDEMSKYIDDDEIEAIIEHLDFDS